MCYPTLTRSVSEVPLPIPTRRASAAAEIPGLVAAKSHPWPRSKTDFNPSPERHRQNAKARFSSAQPRSSRLNRFRASPPAPAEKLSLSAISADNHDVRGCLSQPRFGVSTAQDGPNPCEEPHWPFSSRSSSRSPSDATGAGHENRATHALVDLIRRPGEIHGHNDRDLELSILSREPSTAAQGDQFDSHPGPELAFVLAAQSYRRASALECQSSARAIALHRDAAAYASIALEAPEPISPKARDIHNAAVARLLALAQTGPIVGKSPSRTDCARPCPSLASQPWGRPACLLRSGFVLL